VTTFDHAEHGEVWIAVHEDVTDRRAARDTVEYALAAEREASEHLRETARQQERLLQVVSHDLRGPLTTIIGFAQTLDSLGDKLPDEERRRFLERIVANAERLSELVTRLLDQPVLVEGRSPAKQHPTDVADLVRRLVAAMDLTTHPVEVRADRLLLCVEPTQFERIVENLVANAVRHTPAATPITVTVRRDGDHAALIVEDGGPGIPPELLPDLSTPYRKGAESPGTGLGLALVLGLVEMHGGTVTAANTAGGGAAFTVRIPRRRAAELVEDE
jgi:signal transduction histidine kinase